MGNNPLSVIIGAFCDKYLSLCDKSDEISYKFEAPNTIRVCFEHHTSPDMIFVFESRTNYKLMTASMYETENKAIEELRKQLTISDNNLKNFKRSLSK